MEHLPFLHMKLTQYGPALFAVLALAVISLLPVVSAGQGSVTLNGGETYSKELRMDKGHTMYARFESDEPLMFMVVGPNGNVIRYANSTNEGFFLDADVGGNYTLVWQSGNAAPTSLTYDYNDDVIGLNSPAVQLLILVGAVIAMVLLVVLLRRRKGRKV